MATHATSKIDARPVSMVDFAPDSLLLTALGLEMDPEDPRWQLVQAVVGSPLFEKSPRLRSFLLYVTAMELAGRRQEINEQHIGIQVFGRSANYNPGDDSIVRSQARFLRQRLAEYFATLGTDSPLTIEIPKGSYVPVFEARPVIAAPTEPAIFSPEPVPLAVAPSRPRRIRLWAGLGIAAGLLIVAAMGFALLHRADAGDRFWAGFFDPHRTHLIVPADSTLILYEELTGEEVSFASYLQQQYLAKGSLQQAAPHMSNVDLETSHYTSMADLRLVARLYQLPSIDPQRTQIRSARELSMSDAREDNLILIGGSRANPWVTLFTSQMNFSVDYDPQSHQNRVTNHAPRSSESAFYTENREANKFSVYGLVAYVPSLDRQGHVLMVAGTSSSGTQLAADFLLNRGSLNTFLKKIQRPDGSTPPFELLLGGHSLNGSATGSSIVAYRLPG